VSFKEKNEKMKWEFLKTKWIFVDEIGGSTCREVQDIGRVKSFSIYIYFIFKVNIFLTGGGLK